MSANAGLSTGAVGPTEKWLLAHHDPLASIYTFSQCICFADLNGDGEIKLIIADLGTGMHNMKLNIYRGTSLQSQISLVDVPAGIVTFYMESSESGQSPAIAVASGSFLYVYKNLKPFYRFQLPAIDINQTEADAWHQAKEEKINVTSLKEMLDMLRGQVGEIGLTGRSQAFLKLSGEPAMEEFVRTHKAEPLKRQTVISCLSSIKKTIAEENAVSCLVIGTENKDIFIVEPDAFTVLASVQLPSIPVFVEVNGLFDVEYRLVVSCRDAHIYTIKRGFKTGRLCVQLSSQPVGLLRVNNNVIVGCMDGTIANYTTKGNCLWSIRQPAKISALAAVDVEILGIRLIAVALENNQVHLYHDKHRVDVIETDDPVVAMRHGRYGRESCTLVMVTRNGTLTIKILKRTAKFYPKEITGSGSENSSSQALAASNGSSKLNIPRKTKLFVDQTMRERDESLSKSSSCTSSFFLLAIKLVPNYSIKP